MPLPPTMPQFVIRPFSLVVAMTAKGSIGKGGKIPWEIPEDLKMFSFITRSVRKKRLCNAVIMGRLTFESLPPKYSPLPNRLNIIVSTTMTPTCPNSCPTPMGESVDALSSTPLVVPSFDAALSLVSEAPLAELLESVFVIGGKRLYEEALKHPQLETIFLTRVQGPNLDEGCDVRLVDLTKVEGFAPISVSKTRSVGTITFDFVRLTRLATLQRERRVNPSAPSLEGNELQKEQNELAGRDEAEWMANEIEQERRMRDQIKQFSASLGQTMERASIRQLINEVDGMNEFVLRLDSEAERRLSIDGHAAAQQIELSPDVLCHGTVVDRSHQEFQYLDLIASILREGVYTPDRTGVGTLTKFGALMRFDLSQSFPLLTTKILFWKGVVEELLWFIRGETNANSLSMKGVKIWDANGTREFLDSVGLTDREPGDLGPIYGFQWRHFGAAYTNMNADYRGEGIDQLERCIQKLKQNPMDRRIIISSWNPVDLDAMALPPCHLLAQFFVDHKKRLSCLMYQRSADMGLGVPFNIASYALLTRMIAQVAGLKPGEFIHVIGNAHVYRTHVEPLKEQLKRLPRPFPHLSLDPSIKNIDDFEAKHFNLIGYNPLPRIPMEMAV